MNRKIKGYVFKDLDAWCMIDKVNEKDFKYAFSEYGWHLRKDSICYNRLKRLNILDIVCTPVYEEIEAPKKGTAVICDEGRLYFSMGKIDEYGCLIANVRQDFSTTNSKLPTWTIYKQPE